MINYLFLTEIPVHYLRVSEPFSLEELRGFVVSNPSAESVASERGIPLIIDFRGVDLSTLSSFEIRRHVMWKSDLGREATDVACAYLVDNPDTFAKIQASLVYSELGHVIAKGRALLSEDVDEVAQWVSELTRVAATHVADWLDDAPFLYARG